MIDYRCIAGIAIGLIIALALTQGGCPPEDYPNAVPAVPASEIDAIVRQNLPDDETRAELEALGLSPLTVNAILRDKQFANQFGGSIRTAYAKVTEPDFLDLTPDEIQVFNFFANEADPNLQTTVNDGEAQSVVDFFYEYDLRTPDDIQGYLDAGGSIWTSIPEDLIPKLFLDFDPNLVIPLMP